MTFDRKVAVVTGAAGGLGRAICEVLAEEGAAVVGVDLAGEGVLHHDIATAEGNDALIADTLERHGRIDRLVLNAGVQHISPIASFPEREWDRLFGVMAKGPFLTMRAAWPELTRRRGSRIVVTASASSFAAEERKAAYVAAKHAVLGLVKVAALEGVAHGLTVNAVAPGWMETPMVENQLEEQMRRRGLSRDEALAWMAGFQPAQRFVEVREVAQTIAFLASDRASGLNGVCVPVDLGALAGS